MQFQILSLNVLLNEMSQSYPELKIGKELIVETLKNEEEKFSSLLDRGMKILNQNLEKVKNNTLPGEIAFKLYDTYGFPLDLTEDILKNKSLKMLLQIHDELIFGVDKEEANKYSKIIKDEMMSVKDNNMHLFSVPLSVDINIGDNWGDLH